MKSNQLLEDKRDLAFIIILILFFIFNFISLLNRDFFVDEVITYNIVNKLSFKEIFKGIDVHPFGYYTLMKLLPHSTIYILRYYSLVITVIAIICMYLFLKNHYPDYSVIMAIIMIGSATIAYYATEARMYSLLFLISVYIFISYHNKRYNLALLLMALSMFFHYYAIFLFIPYIFPMIVNYGARDFKNKAYIMKAFITLFIVLLWLLPAILNQFLGYNPYKIPPPHDKPDISTSLPSMIIFPLINPSKISSNVMLIVSYVVLFILVYLAMTFRHKKNNLQLFCFGSILGMNIIFLLAFIFKTPYHHRYTIIFYPMIYFMLIHSLYKKYLLLKIILLSFIILLLVMSSFHFYTAPSNQFLTLSRQIACPQNILHETPFSFLPMSVYLPDCNHYMAKEEDWKELTSKTLYTTPDKINNYDISYDIYLFYFQDLKAPQGLLDKSYNVRYVKVID